VPTYLLDESSGRRRPTLYHNKDRSIALDVIENGPPQQVFAGSGIIDILAELIRCKVKIGGENALARRVKK
jgi:hypothetical protein